MTAKTYKLHSEVKAFVGPQGYKGLGISKDIDLPDDTIQDLMKPIADLENQMEDHLSEFEELVENRKKQIRNKLGHIDFFNKEFGKNQWSANREFDQLRIRYIMMQDSLEKEMRSLDREKLMKKMAIKEKIADLKKELSPFRLF
jgi:hypothetical protein